MAGGYWRLTFHIVLAFFSDPHRLRIKMLKNLTTWYVFPGKGDKNDNFSFKLVGYIEREIFEV